MRLVGAERGALCLIRPGLAGFQRICLLTVTVLFTEADDDYESRMSSNQRTLFQTWGCSVSRTSEQGKTTSERSKNTSERRKTTSEQTDSRSLWGETATAAADEDDDDDDVMLVAVYETERALEAGPEPGFDPSAGRIWIYPTNLPVRQYQLQICEAALLRNTLVCLPTGLGKTFIAAVIMYNYYRWFPAGKIVFMAPTKPLVAQQIQACHGVMGIPQPHMAELTGQRSRPLDIQIK